MSAKPCACCALPILGDDGQSCGSCGRSCHPECTVEECWTVAYSDEARLSSAHVEELLCEECTERLEPVIAAAQTCKRRERDEAAREDARG